LLSKHAAARLLHKSFALLSGAGFQPANFRFNSSYPLSENGRQDACPTFSTGGKTAETLEELFSNYWPPGCRTSKISGVV